MAYIANPNKAVKIRWVRWPDTGCIYCSCGYRNNFYGKYQFKCSNCGMALDVKRIAKDPAHIKRGME